MVGGGSPSSVAQVRNPNVLGCRLVTSGKTDGILDHGFDFRPAWWTQPYIPAAWSGTLHALPGAEQGRGYHRIIRRDLLAGPRPHRAETLGALLLACYAWGSGPTSFTVNRRRRVFRDIAPEMLAERLAAAVGLLAAESPESAYAALHDGGQLRVKHMRASFSRSFYMPQMALGTALAGEHSSSTSMSRSPSMTATAGASTRSGDGARRCTPAGWTTLTRWQTNRPETPIHWCVQTTWSGSTSGTGSA